jgi:hypothetical protein
MTASSGHQAHLNGDQVHTYPPGNCQKFVRLECWQVGSLYGSAIEAWNGAREKHPGDRDAPEGAPLYYRGGQYGHAVLNQKANSRRARGTDNPTSGQVNDHDLSWPETAWGYEYLGWTGDINGVDLPLGSSGDSGGGEDDMNLQDEISEWSPDEGSTGDTTVGKTLNQARGYAEDSYDRVKQLQGRMDRIESKLDKILNAVT